jgi:hypothetical protein
MEGKYICRVMLAKGNIVKYTLDFTSPMHYGNWLAFNERRGYKVIDTTIYSQENLRRLL